MKKTIPTIPKNQRHEFKELHGLGGGWTCVRCKKHASQCYGKERYYCSGERPLGLGYMQGRGAS